MTDWTKGLQLPQDLLAILIPLTNRELTPSEQLRCQLSDHLVHLKEVSNTIEFIDLGTAIRVAALCHKLLHRVEEAATEKHRRLAHAACLYFLLDEDAESDIHSPTGFDDDLEVVIAVARALGAHDLVDG